MIGTGRIYIYYIMRYAIHTNMTKPTTTMKSFIYILLIMVFCSVNTVNAQHFNENFKDSTLRIDYVFSGNRHMQMVAVDKLNVMPVWYGKKTNLAELPVEGNGQITVRDYDSGDVIYRNSFSTLFQEWLSYDDAIDNVRSFENIFLIPMPRRKANVTVDIRNNRREIMKSFTHVVNPEDILIKQIGFKNVTPYKTLQQAEDTTRCIHIAYIAEGYKQEEMNVFLNDAKTANDAIFAHEPFKKYKGRFNVIAVMSPSEESGCSEPSAGIWRKTALNSHFDTFYSDRYLTTLNLKDMHDILAGTPYEHIIVLVNTNKYGGGGILNSYNLSMTHHDKFKQVVVHEFGHSFAGLADEYAYETEDIPMYPHDIEPWERNITTLVDFHGKWENMIDKGTLIPTPLSSENKNKVGIYEGAGYSLHGVFRGQQECRMRTNETAEFCQICQKAITDIIKFYTE